MKQTFLDFEQPIAELQAKIDELRYVHEDSAVDISDEITRLQKKSNQLTKEIYGKLTAWQIAMVARHPQRPYTLDYINSLFSDFRELHGDRSYADDPAIVGGLARFNGKPCMVLGHQKGRDTKEKIYRNFGMPRPEGYRKALRLMKLAEKFGLPLFTFVDTPGAYPGIGAEERGQSEAIGRNLYEMAGLRVPIVVTVIGEGGSGGALAIAIGDVTLMLQYATYSVISPEGCASILWKSAEQAPEAAETLGITAPRLKQLGLIDKVLNEPPGGAHRDPAAMMVTLKKALTEALRAPQGSAARYAARDAGGQDPLVRQVQGDPRRLTLRPPPPVRSVDLRRVFRDRHAGLIRRRRRTGARRRARSVRRGRTSLRQRRHAPCASSSRCRADATRWCSSTRSRVSRRSCPSRCPPRTSITACRRMPMPGRRSAPTNAPPGTCRSRCIACASRARAARASRPPRARHATRRSRRVDADVIALAHHADDQAETHAAAAHARRGTGRARGDAAHRSPAAGPALLRPLLVAAARRDRRLRARSRPRVGRRRVECRHRRQAQFHPARHRAAPRGGVSRLSGHARARRRSPGRGGAARRRSRAPRCARMPSRPTSIAA